MKINEYQELAMRTANKLNNFELIENGVLGLCGETGEVADHIKKVMFQGHELDKDKLVEELGDVCWYIAILAKGLNVDLETVMQKNIEKLIKRYPDGFKVENSVNREEYTIKEEPKNDHVCRICGKEDCDRG